MHDVYISETLVKTVGVIVGVIAVSGVTEVFKKWFRLQSAKVITFLFTAVSFASVAIESLVSATSSNATLLGTHTAMIMGFATLAYRYGIKPFSGFLSDVKSSKATTSVPTPESATTAPISAASPSEDF